MKVLIVFGSKNDTEAMKGAAVALREFGVEYEAYVLSAHRVPEQLIKTINESEKKGCKVIIAGAGLAAHLPGVCASQTTMPVIGVPLKGALEGLDALLSIVQMPKSIPVATVAINNSYNAGMLAVQILATGDTEFSEKLKQYRKTMKENFLKDNLQGEKL